MLLRWLRRDEGSPCPLGRPVWRWRSESASSWVPARAVLGPVLLVPVVSVDEVKGGLRAVRDLVRDEGRCFVLVEGMLT